MQCFEKSWNKWSKTSSKRKGHSVETNIKNRSVACILNPSLCCSGSIKVIQDPEGVPKVAPSEKKKHHHWINISPQHCVSSRVLKKIMERGKEVSSSLQSPEGAAGPACPGTPVGGCGRAAWEPCAGSSDPRASLQWVLQPWWAPLPPAALLLTLQLPWALSCLD